jgi:hypothetical protein
MKGRRLPKNNIGQGPNCGKTEKSPYRRATKMMAATTPDEIALFENEPRHAFLCLGEQRSQWLQAQ